MSQGSLVVAATTVAVLGVAVPRHSPSRGLDLPHVPVIHMSGPPSGHSDSSVWTFDAPVPQPKLSLGPPGLNVAFRPSTVFDRFDLPLPTGEAPAQPVLTAR